MNCPMRTFTGIFRCTRLRQTPRYLIRCFLTGTLVRTTAMWRSMANNWTGLNIQRYVNPEFDRLYQEATATIDPELAAGLYMQMNDLLVGDYVVVPLIARSDQFHAISNRLAAENIATNSWEPLFWNIANWRTVEE